MAILFQVFYTVTSTDGCIKKKPKQPLVGPNVETVLEVQVIALAMSLYVQAMQEVSRHPMVVQEIPKQPVASSTVTVGQEVHI